MFLVVMVTTRISLVFNGISLEDSKLFIYLKIRFEGYAMVVGAWCLIIGLLY